MAKQKTKKVAWDLKNDQVMVVAAGKMESLIDSELMFVTYNKRFYRPSKYIATYASGKINGLYEITTNPLDDCNLENTPSLSKFVADVTYDVTATTNCRVFNLKKVKNLSIVNNSTSKTGKNIPFTYGNTRYTTLSKIDTAKFTSDLIGNTVQDEEVILDEVGGNTCIQPNDAKIILEWSSADDFDLALAYQDMSNEKGLIYFKNKGVLNAFPYMQLTKDAGAGFFTMLGFKSKKQESISIKNMDKIKTAYLICWDWKKGDLDKANFDKSDAKISIVDSEGFTSTSKLLSEGGYNAVCIATIEQKQDSFVLTNCSKGFVKTIDISVLFHRLTEALI